MKFYLFFLLLVSNLPLFSQHEKLNASIDSLLKIQSSTPFNGLIYCVSDDRIVLNKVQGFSDNTAKSPLNVSDQFVIGSISKQFTAAIILKEYERKNIQLHVPIRWYLPELKQKWADTVTIHQLLTHTHGIVDWNKPSIFPAGTSFNYSQIGYDLLAKIAERATGKKFDALSKELFEKCGMTSSLHPDSEGIKSLVIGYTAKNNELDVEVNSFQNYPAAGGFISTAEDLAKWNECLYEGKFLKKKTLNLMQTQHEGAIRNHPLFGETHYGYGITITHEKVNLQLGQTGFAPGFVSMNYYFPETKTSLIILSNTVYGEDDLNNAFDYHVKVLELFHLHLSN
jgi:CubicO group peptidase (beta-lactamase class C family)